MVDRASARGAIRSCPRPTVSSPTSGDNALTKNYLRFLLEKVVVTGVQAQLVMRNEAVARMMVATSAGGGKAAPERDRRLLPPSSWTGSDCRTRTCDPAANRGRPRSQYFLPDGERPTTVRDALRLALSLAVEACEYDTAEAILGLLKRRDS
jgi:hypothetical protein